MTSRFFRPAVADDAASLAELMYLADQAHYSTSGYAVSIGGSREHQLAELAKLAQAGARSQFHYSHFDVAVSDDGAIAASVAGFDRQQTAAQTGNALEEIGWDASVLEALAGRIGPLGDTFLEEEPGAWTIEHVATLPQYRGQGLARRLLERVLARGAAQGFARACVDVFSGNHKAHALYEAAGFRQVATFGHESLRRILGRDPLIRMMRPLG